MHEQLISRLRWRLGGMLVLRQVVAGLTLWAFLWGTVVIACRVALGESPDWLRWGLGLAPLVALAGLARGLRQMPAATRVRALVDRTSACGGLVMASEEQPLGSWTDRLPEPALLQIHWRGDRPLALFAAAAVFLCISFLFPQRLATWADEGLEIGNDVDQLVTKIDALQDEKILESKRAEFLKERLQQMQKDAAGRDPAKTLEALDHVRDQLSRAAQKAAESAVQKSEQLGKAESLSNGIKNTEGSLDPAIKQEALAELAILVQQAATETELLDLQVDPELLKQMKAAKLSPEDLEKLSKALRGSKGKLAQGLKKLSDLKLIDAEFLKQCENAGKCDCEGALLACKKGGVCDALGKRGGRGGLNEGPGHNAITWTDGTNEEGAKYKEETLPPSGLRNMKDSMTVGVGKADPKSGEVVTSQGGALQRAAAGGGGANAGTLLPQHRGAVERFFLRSEKK